MIFAYTVPNPKGRCAVSAKIKSLELTGTVTALASAIACALTADEAALLAAVLVQLGDTLATIAVWQDLCKEENGD